MMMNKKKAKKILGTNFIESDDELSNSYEFYVISVGTQKVRLRGDFSITELEAIVWCMKNSFIKRQSQ